VSSPLQAAAPSLLRVLDHCFAASTAPKRLPRWHTATGGPWRPPIASACTAAAAARAATGASAAAAATRSARGGGAGSSGSSWASVFGFAAAGYLAAVMGGTSLVALADAGEPVG